ncbi:hypothetical protein EXIGLDRAFT_730311 [Exidia glandulosa HHB12029]|uniref:Uncharacterized protein n=1 Tax=Exidia glandulosa HHB12029 TaxID=1314781 RepID=A0A165C8C6_EXIGL|nr:hypothetical protein EXIGLDRAFT_730311 [Exidia glandulosa HHB12029]
MSVLFGNILLLSPSMWSRRLWIGLTSRRAPKCEYHLHPAPGAGGIHFSHKQPLIMSGTSTLAQPRCVRAATVCLLTPLQW